MNKTVGGLCLFATVLNIVNENFELAFITGILSVLNFLVD